MASAQKHALRSHKSAQKNYTQYRGFVMRAQSNNKLKYEKKSIGERLARFFNIFKRQGR